jgi:hypothetical protein
MSNYFSYIPDLDYVSRLPDSKIGDYIRVKNLFRKGKLREDIFQRSYQFFEKYKIIGNDRPDNVAFEVYGDSKLDWVVLMSNNILNIQTEWPLPQTDFDRFVLDKYGDYNTLYNGVHHYETEEVENSQGVVIVPKGLQVDSSYSISFYDYLTGEQVTTGNLATPITNYEYEEKVENDKRNIFLLKSTYLGLIINDMPEIMEYREGATQYVSSTLKRGDNIKLYS